MATAVFLDFQNINQILSKHHDVNVMSLNLRTLCEDLALQAGCNEPIDIRLFSGMPTDEAACSKQHSIFHFMRKQWGFTTFLRDNKVRHRDDGSITQTEKGIDMRLGAEMVAASVTGKYQSIIVWSADQDLSEAVKVAFGTAKAMGRDVKFYGIVYGGQRNIENTTPIVLTPATLQHHDRSFELTERQAAEAV